MDQNLDERKKKIKDQPNVDHLDVRRLWQVVRDVDEHCGQHQHCCEVHSDHRLKEERLEEVGRTDDRIENNC